MDVGLNKPTQILEISTEWCGTDKWIEIDVSMCLNCLSNDEIDLESHESSRGRLANVYNFIIIIKNLH